MSGIDWLRLLAPLVSVGIAWLARWLQKRLDRAVAEDGIREAVKVHGKLRQAITEAEIDEVRRMSAEEMTREIQKFVDELKELKDDI